MKIRTKILGAAFFGIIPFLIGMSVIVNVGRASDRSKAADLMTEYVRSVATGLEVFFNEARHAVSIMAFLHGGTMMGWAEGGRDFFEGLLPSFSFLNVMSLVDADGFVYETRVYGNPWQGGRRTEDDSDPNSAPISVADRDYFRRLVSDNRRGESLVIVNEPYVPRGRTSKSIVTSAAVIHNGRAAGVVNAMQTSDELSALYANLTAGFMERFGTRASMYLVSREGQLVSLLEYSEERGAYEDSLFGSKEIVSVNALEEDVFAAIDAAARGNAGTMTARINGESCYVSAFRVEGTPFAVCITVPQSYVLAASRSMLSAGLVTFFIIALAMIAGMTLATKSMLSSLGAMNVAIREIADGGGDLTMRLYEGGNDEVAAVCKNFNRFVRSLNGMVGNVSSSAASMVSTGQSLSGNVSAISGDVSTIAKDIENLNFSVEEQSASVTETSATIVQIAHNIESLTHQIESQTAAVTESSAAVQEMVSNIDSISANVAGAAASFDELKSDAVIGMESINAVQDLVNKLTAQSDSLLEANSVIDTIASQTNLLAMNAAIEAAHAGDAGKGFAVVAEEIRNLAENSAEQSRTIATGLKNTLSSIKSIARATAVADSSFNSVASKIDSVTGLVDEINFSIAEQSAGSRQILEGLASIENVTMHIRDGAVEMNSGTETILKEINRLSYVSQTVQERSGSIAKAAETINHALDKIVRDSSSNSRAIDSLVSMTARFKL